MIFKRVGDSRPYPSHGYTQKKWSQLANWDHFFCVYPWLGYGRESPTRLKITERSYKLLVILADGPTGACDRLRNTPTGC